MNEINGFFKQHGAEAADNKLNRISDSNYALYYGYGEDELGGYRWRKDYDHKPSKAELRSDIESLVNAAVEEKILSGFTYNGKAVWLSSANQLNFRFDINCPVRLKLGDDADGNSVYHTFETQEELSDFARSVAAFINQCLNEGWDEKDGIDYTQFGITEE